MQAKEQDRELGSETTFYLATDAYQITYSLLSLHNNLQIKG